MFTDGKIFGHILLAATVFISFAARNSWAAPEIPFISLVTDPASSPPASHGAEKILAALHDKAISAEHVTSPEAATGQTLLIAGVLGKNSLAEKLLQENHQSLAHAAESLIVSKIQYHDKPAWLIAGADSRGLMYGELDVADRITWSTNAATALSELHETTESPDVKTRGVTFFAMNRAYWETRFYDETYWARYFDMLAQNRFNSVVLIFGYEDGGFLAPCYPYFFDTEGFADIRMIGITPDEQQRNLAALNRLIQMAHDRGLTFTVGIWDHIYRGGVQAGGIAGAKIPPTKPTPNLVWGLTGDNLIPYTHAALAKFLRLVPHIDAIQFRMHDESGLKPAEYEPFWHDIFQLLKQQTPDILIDLRAKGLPDSVIQNAVDIGLNFRITTKYWMEQMGLPFHPTHVNPPDQLARRHSYADLLRHPQQYKWNWQLWNGGTARILLWGDPEYVRRFAQTTHLYDGDGFEIDEPLATKMEGQPHDMKPFDLLGPPYRYYDYEFERYWHYYQVFGRIGYNPQTPPEVWQQEFQKRFGPAAPSIETALHIASWILPRIIASSYPYSGFPMTAGWAEKQHLGNLPTFAKAEGSDPQQFENFDEEAQRLIAGGETAKTRPQETSRWFAQTAAAINTQIAEAQKQIGDHQSKEFDSTIVDLKILSNLALYHSRRIPAAVNYRLFIRTKDPRALDDAIAAEQNAIEAWQQLVTAAGEVYAPDLMMGSRPRNLCGHWREELTAMQKDLLALQEQRHEITSPATQPAPPYQPATDAPYPQVTHQPIATAPANQPLTITAEINAPAGIKWVHLRYRSVNQYLDYQTLPMLPTSTPNQYQATIPANHIPPTWDLMYFFEIMDNNAHGTIYPDFNKTTPYIIVHLSR